MTPQIIARELREIAAKINVLINALEDAG